MRRKQDDVRGSNFLYVDVSTRGWLGDPSRPYASSVWTS